MKNIASSGHLVTAGFERQGEPRQTEREDRTPVAPLLEVSPSVTFLAWPSLCGEVCNTLLLHRVSGNSQRQLQEDKVNEQVTSAVPRTYFGRRLEPHGDQVLHGAGQDP